MDRKLYFREDGTFHVMQLTDMHVRSGGEADQKTLRLVRELIAAEKPDFIMITGDLVSGNFDDVNNMEMMDVALAPIVESGIPWSFCFGNHDTEHQGNHREFFDAICQKPNCMLWHDPESVDRLGNSYIELCGKDGAAQWLLFGIDSGDYNPMKEVGGYGFVTPNQIRWYRNRIAEYEAKGKPFSAMVYMHIALPEYRDVWKYEVWRGIKRDGICCPRVNSGFFCAMQEAGHTKGVFVGHDHVNDFWGDLFGIALGYGRCTGFNTYGAQDYARGCRMFTFRENCTEKFDTYVRLENNIVVDDPWVQHPLMGRNDD